VGTNIAENASLVSIEESKAFQILHFSLLDFSVKVD